MQMEASCRAERSWGVSVAVAGKMVTRGWEAREGGSLEGVRQRPLMWTCGVLRRCLAIRRASLPVRPAMVTVVVGEDIVIGVANV